MVATTAYTPSPTKRFAWITDAGERAYQIDKFITVAKTVMARRNVELDSATEEVLRSLATK